MVNNRAFLARNMAPSRACDLCYTVKGKCIVDGNAEACLRCRDLGVVCETNRRRLRLGRRPVLEPFGHDCTVQVWHSEYIGSEVSKVKEDDSPEVSETTATSEVSPESVKLPLKDLDNIHPPKSSLSCQPSLLTDFPAQLLEIYALDLDEFYTANENFVIGPTFTPEFHAALTSIYFCSPSLLKHAYLAILGAMHKSRNNLSTLDEVDLERGAAGLEQLRTITITGIEDARAVLILGQVMATFDIFTISTNSHLILRHALTIVKPWYPALSKEKSLASIAITPLLMDVVECLVRRDVPVIKFSVRDPYLVDRFAGLCTTLLPILYDLCVLSYDTRKQEYSRNQSEGSDVFADIEKQVQSWTPNTPSNFLGTYSTSEVLIMITQARAYRRAALLIIHRLRHPFGVSDDVAEAYAREILQDLAQCFSMLEGKTTMPNTAFPLLLAMIEVSREHVQEIIPKFLSLEPPAACSTKIIAFVHYIRSARESGFRGLWFDLVSQGPEICIVP